MHRSIGHLLTHSLTYSLPFLGLEAFLDLEVGWNIFGFGKYPEDVSITLKAPVDHGSVTENE